MSLKNVNTYAPPGVDITNPSKQSTKHIMIERSVVFWEDRLNVSAQLEMILPTKTICVLLQRRIIIKKYAMLLILLSLSSVSCCGIIINSIFKPEEGNFSLYILTKLRIQILFRHKTYIKDVNSSSKNWKMICCSLFVNARNLPK